MWRTRNCLTATLWSPTGWTEVLQRSYSSVRLQLHVEKWLRAVNCITQCTFNKTCRGADSMSLHRLCTDLVFRQHWEENQTAAQIFKCVNLNGCMLEGNCKSLHSISCVPPPASPPLHLLVFNGNHGNRAICSQWAAAAAAGCSARLLHRGTAGCWTFIVWSCLWCRGRIVCWRSFIPGAFSLRQLGVLTQLQKVYKLKFSKDELTAEMFHFCLSWYFFCL